MGKYQLVRRLATGGMAEVFLAKAAGPMGFEKELVVKRILPHLAEDPRFVEMFLTEAKLAARLNHGNCVQIFDFGEQEDAYFIAMEYVEGLNLKILARRAFQQGTPISFPLAARIVSLACEGLAYAHELVDPETGQPLGFIHRDISTDNILVSKTGGVKVVDFGIAKAVNLDQQTQGGVIKGKLSYLPPEYLMGSPINLTADIYALGVVLYELIAGRKPFMAENEAQLVQLIIHGQPADVQTFRADVPKALIRVLERALHKNREARYASCRQMQADLERFLFQCGEPVGTIQIADLVKTLAAVTDVPPGRRISQESLAVAPDTARVYERTARLTRGTHSGAVTSPDDTIVTPPPPAGNTVEEDEELLRRITRPRWQWPVAIAASLLVLGAAAIHFGSKEAPPPPEESEATNIPSAPTPSPAPPTAQPILAAQENPEPPQVSTSREASKPSPPVEEKAPASADVKPEAAAPTAMAAIPSGPARLTVTSNFRAEVLIDGLRVGTTSREGSTTIWKGTVRTGNRQIVVQGTEKKLNQERPFKKQRSYQFAAGEEHTEPFIFKLVAVKVQGVPAGATVLSLDDESVDSQDQVKTYEGRHMVVLSNPRTGKTYSNICEVEFKAGRYLCTIVPDAKQAP